MHFDTKLPLVHAEFALLSPSSGRESNRMSTAKRVLGGHKFGHVKPVHVASCRQRSPLLPIQQQNVLNVMLTVGHKN